MTGQRTRDSKRMSWALRHAPEEAGIRLDPAGWTDVSELSAALRIPVERIEAVVAADAKQRYALADGRIRAQQGHSVAVELGLEPLVPPALLFHGTVERFLDAILREGLRPGSRHHVHLSGDVETARTVGQRRGRPVVLEVAAGRAHGDGLTFYRSGNGVWLVDALPASYLRVLG